MEKKMNFRTFGFSLVAVACLAVLLLTSSIASQPSEQTVGKSWPTAQRISMNEIDHSDYSRLLQKYVNRDGMVNYEAWKANASDRQALNDYLNSIGRADPNLKATNQAKMAYWINAYNAVTLEGILRVYPTTSIRNHTAKLVGYNIWKNLLLHSGDQKVSLEDIEHKILRPMGEPRIHFAIVCASIGCPRLLNEAYTTDRLEQQLAINSKDFFSRAQNLQFDAAKKQIQVSSILSWFGEDFGSDKTAQIKRVAGYFPQPAQAIVAGGNFNVGYLTYNWDLNKQ